MRPQIEGARSGSGTVAEQLTDETMCLRVCVLCISELHFVGESVSLEPVEELGAIGAKNTHLREVDVCVDEAGHQNAVLVLANRDIRVFGTKLRVVADCLDFTVLHDK